MKGGSDRQTDRQERTVKWSEFKEARRSSNSLERDKESHVTHIKGRLKVSKPKEKVKVEAGRPVHPPPLLFPKSTEGANLTVLQVGAEL